MFCTKNILVREMYNLASKYDVKSLVFRFSGGKLIVAVNFASLGTVKNFLDLLESKNIEGLNLEILPLKDEFIVEMVYHVKLKEGKVGYDLVQLSRELPSQDLQLWVEFLKEYDGKDISLFSLILQ